MADHSLTSGRQLPSWVLPTFLTLLRVAAGLMFMQHGAQKLFGALGGEQVEFASMMGFAGVVEFVGGLLVAIGLGTRVAALLAGVQMIAAYFMAHAPQGGLPVQNQGELALLYAFVFLFFFAYGAGPWSADAAIRRNRR